MSLSLNKILITLCLFLAGALAMSQWKVEQTMRKYLNVVADTSRVVQERDGIYSKLLTVEKRITELRQDSAFRDLKITELLGVIKKKDARITGLIAFQAAWKPDTVTIPGEQDTIVIGKYRRDRVTFSTEIKGDSVYGHTLTNPPEAFIGLKKRPVSFAVALVEGENGQYETVLTSDNPYLEISAAIGQVVPYKKTGFLQRFFSGPAIYGGWTKERGVNVNAVISIWKIEPFLEFHEAGLDYGGRIEIWKKSW